MTDPTGLFSLCNTTLPCLLPLDLSSLALLSMSGFCLFGFCFYCYSLSEGIKGSASLTLSCILLTHKVLGKDKGKGTAKRQKGLQLLGFRFVFQRGPSYIAWASLKLAVILLPQSPKSWNCRHVSRPTCYRYFGLKKYYIKHALRVT